MKTSKILIAAVLATAILISQVGSVFATSSSKRFISGVVTALTCETDPVTTEMTFLVTVQKTNGIAQTVRIDQATADSLDLLERTADGNPDCRQEALDAAIGMEVTIDAAQVLSDVEEQHPAGAALATFFSEITTYDAIMEAHENGTGFGLIAQVLWLTKKLNGDTETFLAILLARQTGDYSAFTYDEGVAIPQNWGQFRKLILDRDEKNSLGIVMSEKGEEQPNNGHGENNNQGNRGGNGQGHGNVNHNTGNGQGNGQGHGQGNGHGNGNNNP